MSKRILQSGEGLNYFCTWSAQNRVAEQKAAVLASKGAFVGDQGAKGGRNMMTEALIFGDDELKGFVTLYPEVHSDLMLILDDGWDIPFDVHPGENSSAFGSLEINEGRFPSLKGSPAERLKQMNDRVKAAGWKGIGIWVAAQKAGADYAVPFDPAAHEPYWRERILWCKYADVRYWKVDWGKQSSLPQFRELLTDLGKQLYPELVIEHTRCVKPYNGIPKENKPFYADNLSLAEQTLTILKKSRVFRSYDVTCDRLSATTTLDRLSFLLSAEGGFVNCEDELYIGAALGCALGIMRNPWGSESRAFCRCLAEVTAAVKWQRIAPPFAGGELVRSEEILTDKCYFYPGDTWCAELLNTTLTQAAPAVMARNTALPLVKPSARPAFVLASQNPSGAYAVAAVRRYQHLQDTTPPNVTCQIGGACTVGVFGNFASLTLQGKTPVTRVVAESLFDGVSEDITHRVTVNGSTVTISGEVLDALCRATDESENAVMLRLA